MNRDFWKIAATRLSFVAFAFFSIVLPFAQVQQTRFTSIGILVFLGAFILAVLLGKKVVRVSNSELYFFGLFSLFILFPLLDFWRWQNPNEAIALIVLRLPFLVVPFLVIQMRDQWPKNWPKIVFSLFSLSLIINVLLSSGLGLDYIWQSVQGDHSDELPLWMQRPYYGLVIGSLILSALPFYKRPTYQRFICLLFLFTGLGFLFLIMAKMSIISLFMSILMIIWLFIYLEKVKWRLFLWLLPIIFFVCGILYVGQLSIWTELSSKGEIQYKTVSKVYSNSVNTRLLLWKASAKVLFYNHNWILGLGTSNVQPVLDEAIRKMNEYAYSRHYNPHNLFLSEWLEHGLLGFIFAILLFVHTIWRFVKFGNLYFAGAWLFILICSMTEVFTNRELGVQVMIWLAVVSFFYEVERLNPNPGQNETLQ